MDRLTEHWNSKYIHIKGCRSLYCNQERKTAPTSNAVVRLNAIEDILGDEYDLDRLGELVKARDEGRVVVLPCKVGEIVYYVLPDCNECFGYLVSEPHRVTEVGTRGFWTSAAPDDEPDAMSDFTPWSDFGKTVFLTRAEAEAAIGGGGDGV